MDIARIEAILADSLGETDEANEPAVGCVIIDMSIVSISYNSIKVRSHAAEMIELLKDWPSESWGHPIPPLGEEINYIAAGGALEDQRRALMLFAFGKLLDWWDILSPVAVFGMSKDDPVAQQLVGGGLLSIIGYRPTSTVRD